jgi:hypothetical protein
MLAEVAVALAGFTGIVATFGGRSRDYSDVDRIRLEGIFLASACVFANSLGVLTLSGTDLPPEAVYAYGAMPGVAALLRFLLSITPRAYALSRNVHTTTSTAIISLGIIQALLSVALLLGNAVVWRTTWPLFAASSVQLLWALLLFARLLVRPN